MFGKKTSFVSNQLRGESGDPSEPSTFYLVVAFCSCVLRNGQINITSVLLHEQVVWATVGHCPVLTGWISKFWKKNGAVSLNSHYLSGHAKSSDIYAFSATAVLLLWILSSRIMWWLMGNSWMSIRGSTIWGEHLLYLPMTNIVVSSVFSRGFPKIYSITELTVWLWGNRCWTSVVAGLTVLTALGDSC